MVPCFLVRFLFFLKGWHNNTKVKDLTLCQFSHLRGCKVAFGCFIVIIVCFASVLGLGPRLGNFACLRIFQNVFEKHCKTQAANECVELILKLTLLNQTLE